MRASCGPPREHPDERGDYGAERAGEGGAGAVTKACGGTRRRGNGSASRCGPVRGGAGRARAAWWRIDR
ncbi:hypothetical protein [Streptomyces sp. NPDC059378]|uniref:hypothetical protein n=1 Tax=Streptomyces sp. NPDC059378 TaxID=3346815 RepID=UPI0036B6DF8D